MKLSIFTTLFILCYFTSGNSGNKFTNEELKKRLTPLQYHVTQEKGTER